MVLLEQIISGLAAKGLSQFVSLIKDKGIDVIEDMTGIAIEDADDSTIEALASWYTNNQKTISALTSTMDTMLASTQRSTEAARSANAEASTKGKSWFERNFYHLLAFVVIIGGMIYGGLVTFISIPTANTRFADTVLGFVLGGLISPLVNYYYGSAYAPTGQTETIAQNAKALADTAGTISEAVSSSGSKVMSLFKHN